MITVYMQPNCPHCEDAMAYLTQNGISFLQTNIRADANALALMLEKKHGTTPQIYVGGNLLVEGGNAGLRALTRDQILERIVVLT